MIYEIIITPEAENDIMKLRKSGDKIALKKLNTLVDELREHPTTGTGKPEQLKHNYTNCWSRKITDKHRLIYKIENEKIIVIILGAYGHYNDK